MRFDRKIDRVIVRKVEKTQPYESRASINSRFNVNAIVSKLASGLGDYNGTRDRVEDKYYIRNEMPTRDQFTELGNYGLASGLGGGMGMLFTLSLLAIGPILAIHGYERNDESLTWAVVWGGLGGIIWPIALVLMLIQGFKSPVV